MLTDRGEGICEEEFDFADTVGLLVQRSLRDLE